MKHNHLLAAVLLTSALCLCAKCCPGYILQTQNGTVCVIDAQTGTILADTKTPAASLPETDQQALAFGIFCSTLQELTRIQEDYCS